MTVKKDMLAQTILLKAIEENRIKKGSVVFSNQNKPDYDIRLDVRKTKENKQYALLTMYSPIIKDFKYLMISIINDTVYLELTNTYNADYCYAITSKGSSQKASFTKIGNSSVKLLSKHVGKYGLIPYYTKRNLYYLVSIRS